MLGRLGACLAAAAGASLGAGAGGELQKTRTLLRRPPGLTPDARALPTGMRQAANMVRGFEAAQVLHGTSL